MIEIASPAHDLVWIANVINRRNLAAGETVSVSAPTPLAVIVGRADATEVTVRGKPFDLTAVARENVARFEVK